MWWIAYTLRFLYYPIPQITVYRITGTRDPSLPSQTAKGETSILGALAYSLNSERGRVYITANGFPK